MILKLRSSNIRLRRTMKDLPHHLKKLNRRVIRSMHREELEEERLPEVPTQPETKQSKRKKKKIQIKKERLAHVPSDPTPEERNRIMRGGRSGRVPIFDRLNNQKPKRARPTKKKTPRI